jgi:8-oxo-dGTP pyrophosphatase MutT (NUDIX family)
MSISTTLLRQAGLIPILNGRVCVVTSRSGKRWVIPKGCMEPGMTAGEVALQEAWEEAGLVGTLSPEPVGSYLYEKAGLTCHVIVFLLNVTSAAEQWPEQLFRERSWLTFNQAASRLDDPGLQDILRAVAARAAK